MFCPPMAASFAAPIIHSLVVCEIEVRAKFDTVTAWHDNPANGFNASSIIPGLCIPAFLIGWGKLDSFGVRGFLITPVICIGHIRDRVPVDVLIIARFRGGPRIRNLRRFGTITPLLRRRWPWRGRWRVC